MTAIKYIIATACIFSASVLIVTLVPYLWSQYRARKNKPAKPQQPYPYEA